MGKNHMFLPDRAHKQALKEVPWGFLIAAVLHMTILLVVQKGKAICQPSENTELLLPTAFYILQAFITVFATIGPQ